MKTRNILMIIDSFDLAGTETYVLSIVEEMMKDPHNKLVLVGREGVLEQSFERLGCRTYVLDIPKIIDWKKINISPCLDTLKTIIEEEQITIIHAHQTPSAFLAFSAAKPLDIPTIFTVHGTYYAKEELQKVLEFSTHVISVSVPVHGYIKKEFGVDSIIIPNGINTERFYKHENIPIRAQLGIPENAIVLLYASRLSWKKGSNCMTFLRACKDIHPDYPTVYVIVAGDGKNKKDIQKLAEFIHTLLNKEFIFLVGERLDLEKYYSIADCVIGTGRVALEAMACEKPVLALGNAGYVGLIEKETYEIAWNCYFGDHGAIHKCSRYLLAGDIIRLITNKPKLWSVGGECRQWVLDNFHISKVVQQIITVYDKQLGGKNE